jgi:hypothetical protein
MITQTLARTWDLYRRHSLLIAAVIVVVWLPLELISGYLGVSFSG